jgi:aspartate kinase
VAIAAALGLRECEIFTDVAGVFSADPRVVPDARQLAAISRDEMLQLAAAGAGVLQPRAVELAAAHDIDIHVRSSFTTAAGTWLQEETVFEQADITGVAHRERESFYTVSGASPAVIAAALAERGAAVGSMVRDGDKVHITAPGAEQSEIVAALFAAGARVLLRDEMGSVSIVGTGVGRRPEVTALALRTLEAEGIRPQLVTSTPSRVSFHLPERTVHHAVRLLHTAFGLHQDIGTERRRDRVTRSAS